MNSIREHAVVLGGSIAGLFSAHVLSDHFDRVTVIERDPVHDHPEARKGQPQARQLHVVLTPAHDFLRDRMPKAYQNLLAEGAFTVDAGDNVVVYGYGGYGLRESTGLPILQTSRALFEYHVRNGVLQSDNVTFVDNTKADRLLLNDTGTQVIGVEVTHRGGEQSTELLYADLVVDACGRGTPLPKWLSQLGYEAPEKEEVKINVGYGTRFYKRHGEHIDNPLTYLIFGTPPDEMITGSMVPVEDHLWCLGLTGFHGHHPSDDEDQFLEAVRNLAAPDIYDIISQSEPVTEIRTHKYPASRRYRYDKLERFPDGLIPIGDSAASFNPVYGQGMSSAALQVESLNSLLQRHTGQSIWQPFFKAQAAVVELVWMIAVGADFRYPQTEGNKPPGTDIINRYMTQVNIATQTDPVIHKQFGMVLQLLQPPTTLFHPRIIWRVLRNTMRRKLMRRTKHQSDPIADVVNA